MDNKCIMLSTILKNKKYRDKDGIDWANRQPMTGPTWEPSHGREPTPDTIRDSAMLANRQLA